MFSNIISEKTRKYLLILAFSLFAFSFISCVAYAIKDHNERVEYNVQQDENAANGLPSFAGPYCFPDKHPPFLSFNILVASLILATIYFRKTFLVSFVFTAFYFSRFIYWAFDTQKLLNSLELSHFEGLDQFFYKSTIWDFLTLSILSTLLFWQISILLRMLIKTLQKEEFLP